MDLTDRGRGDGNRIPLREHLLWGLAQFGLDHLGRQFGGHGWGVLLELSQGVTNRFGHPLVQEAGHLTQLHHGALQVAKGLGHLGGRLDLMGEVELISSFGISEGPPGPVQRPRSTSPGRGPCRDQRPAGTAGGTDRSQSRYRTGGNGGGIEAVGSTVPHDRHTGYTNRRGHGDTAGESRARLGRGRLGHGPRR